MFTIQIQGIQSLKIKLESKQVSYKIAADLAIDFAHETILNRVKAGQKVDGAYRTTNAERRIGRYSQRQAKFRSGFGLSTATHNLKVEGNLFDNFKKTVGRYSPSKTYSRSLYFTRKNVIRPNRKYEISYKRLAEIQEAKTGEGFNLSPSQMLRVRQIFKQQIMRQN
jgi:hypothetical protein